MVTMRTLTAAAWKKSPAERGLDPGFTLIELAVVLAIIGLIAALVFPRLGSLGSGSLRSAARRIEGSITLGYNLSIMEKTNYRIAFDLDQQCFRGEKKQGPEYVKTGTDLLGVYCLPDSVAIQELEVLDRQIAQGGSDYIYFSPYGYVEPARIYLVNDSGAAYSLFTDPVTGRVKVYEGKVEFRDLEK